MDYEEQTRKCLDEIEVIEALIQASSNQNEEEMKDTLESIDRKITNTKEYLQDMEHSLWRDRMEKKSE